MYVLGCTVVIKNIKNMHAVTTNPIADILYYNDNRNHSPEVINIQRHKAELNIILPRVNNFDIKQKRHGIFVLS